ncbi:MAG: penicillin-binding transpeptidase domain-containing protein [Halofilum sp. (in: g-proteobacteria)]|nr:penicillin-binding transpeptidase domain-containing protein [Halofilum sp. (in: g-proteobacteria)]
MKRTQPQSIARGRRLLVVVACALAGLLLAGRAVELQVLNREFLRGQADVRHVRTVPVPAHRGMILDRNGEPLAISTPVWSIWADPGALGEAPGRWGNLAAALGMSRQRLAERLQAARGREFVWLQRHLTPGDAERVLALDVPGVGKRREYRRYYPTGEVSGQVLGFTGIDDRGQEGLELAFDDWLSGRPGRKRVVQDRLGRVIEDLELLRPAEHGRDLRVTLDRRLQYLAYRELKAAVQRHGARAGSLVMLDVHSGEVLAMVNQPAFNPNDTSERSGELVRNRAVTDVFEPGSTMKALTIAAALDSGRYRPGTPVFDAPATLRVAGHVIRDPRELGTLDVAGVIRKSSNVGASKIALSLEPRRLWETFARFGLGTTTGSGFPGEVGGRLPSVADWGPVEQATIAYGYGISVTPLQLARAYAAIAADGMLPPVRFRRPGVGEDASGQRMRATQPASAGQIGAMLESVVSAGGTGGRAAVAGYRVAGKTGTAHKVSAGGYAEDRYRAVFAGFAPASEPRIATVVLIDEPQGREYYGGQVAAPVFARVVAGALRLLDIQPDDPGRRVVATAAGGRP